MGAAIHITGMQWNAIGRTAVTTRLFRTNSDAGNAVREEDLDRQLEPNPGRFIAITNGTFGGSAKLRLKENVEAAGNTDLLMLSDLSF
nr:hypothetical protein Iba_chr03aCG9490 [Ipomoea batatas]GMD19112.1 hypothetical protein Iba_chr07eCG5370 [Ipomoea batatas]